MNTELLNNMLAFTQYMAACASTSEYESEIVAEIRKLQPQIKAALAAPTGASQSALTDADILALAEEYCSGQSMSANYIFRRNRIIEFARHLVVPALEAK